MLTFLGGPRACIGYRFSLVEYVPSMRLPTCLLEIPTDAFPHRACRMKAIIYTVIRAFEFELAVPAEDIQRRSTIVQRPLLRSAPEQGTQMPLLVKPYNGL